MKDRIAKGVAWIEGNKLEWFGEEEEVKREVRRWRAKGKGRIAFSASLSHRLSPGLFWKIGKS